MVVLKSGDFFGGKSLWNNASSAATVKAEFGLICFTINRQVFQELLTPVIQKLQEAAIQYEMFVEKQI